MAEQHGVLLQAGGLFSGAELQAMQLDGLLQRICGDSYVHANHPAGPVERARSAVSVLPAALRGRVAVARDSAAWVYGCAPLPPVVHLVTDHRRRTTALPPHTRALMHQVTLGPRDVIMVGGIGVTTPLRTALDVAMHAEEEAAVVMLRRLAGEASLNCPLGLVAAALGAARRVPGKAAAQRRVDRAIGTPLPEGETTQARRCDPVVR
jgi:hypothetical protein